MRQPDPCTIHCHVSRSCCHWIHEWRGGKKKKKDGAADYMPASRREAHLTQPIWSRDKASFQTWLQRNDKKRGSRDYTRHRLGHQEALFQCSLLWMYFYSHLKPSHRNHFHITLKSATIDSTNVDSEELMFSSCKEDPHYGLRAPHTDHKSRHHSICITQHRMLDWRNTFNVYTKWML